MRSHLVIQGPLVSVFTKYCPPQPGPDCIERNGQRAYRAANNIQRIAETYRERFDTIVVSTWDDEELLPNQARLDALGVKILRLPTASVAKLPNHFKQVIGVLEGCKAVVGLDPADRITKTRTDVWFDLAKFIEHAEQVDRDCPRWREVNQLGFIHCGNSRGPFFLEDMFSTALAQDFLRMWEASQPDRHTFVGGGIHESLGLEYAWQNRQALGIPKEMFWDFYRWIAPWHTSIRELLAENRLWHRLLTHCLCLAPDLEPEQFIWRGGPSNHQTNHRRLKRYQFFEQWELLLEHQGGLAQLTDLEYFEGRKPGSLRGYLGEARRAMRIRRTLRASR